MFPPRKLAELDQMIADLTSHVELVTTVMQEQLRRDPDVTKGIRSLVASLVYNEVSHESMTVLFAVSVAVRAQHLIEEKK